MGSLIRPHTCIPTKPGMCIHCLSNQGSLTTACAFKGTSVGNILIMVRFRDRAYRRMWECLRGRVNQMARGHRTKGAETGKIASICLHLIACSKYLSVVKMEEIRSIQKKHEGWRKAKLNPEGVLVKEKAIWVPSDEQKMKLRILVAAHCGNRGHCGHDSTKQRVRSCFWWSNLETDVQEFFHSCFHCVLSKTGKRISRLLSIEVHGQRPNEVVHIDFLHISLSGNNGLQ